MWRKALDFFRDRFLRLLRIIAGSRRATGAVDAATAVAGARRGCAGVRAGAAALSGVGRTAWARALRPINMVAAAASVARLRTASCGVTATARLGAAVQAGGVEPVNAAGRPGPAQEGAEAGVVATAARIATVVAAVRSGAVAASQKMGMAAAALASRVARRVAEAFSEPALVGARQAGGRPLGVGAVAVAAGSAVAPRAATKVGRVDASAARPVAVAVDIRAGAGPGLGRRAPRRGAGSVPAERATRARRPVGAPASGRVAREVAAARRREGRDLDTY